MKTTTQNFFLAFICLLTVHHAAASIFDNRFFPLYQRPFITAPCRDSHTVVEGMITTADSAWDDNEKEIRIPDLFGTYNQRKLGQAFVAIGQTNPIKSEWRNTDIGWEIEGKVQSQGFALAHHQHIWRGISMGIYGYFMNVNARHTFFLNREKTDERQLFDLDGNMRELDDLRRSMHKSLGMHEPRTSVFGMGDIDVYLRYGHVWNYALKFRTIDAGLKVGVLCPSGKKRDINDPASVPFGGNGHFGMYTEGQVEFELKEDLKLGGFVNISKRFSRTSLQRMPVAGEHPLFGAVVGDVKIEPGTTVAFAPYLSLENVRGGLGLRLEYYVVYHGKDEWFDARSEEQRIAVPVQLDDIRKKSSWASEHITVNAFYDFGKHRMPRRWDDPIVTFSWDIPTAYISARHIPRTHRVVLGVEFNF